MDRSGALPPETTYSSRQSLTKDINAWATPRGFTFVSRSSAKRKNGELRVYFSCNRRNKPPGPLPNRRNASQATGCEYSVLARGSSDGSWQLTHRGGPKYARHNHPLNVARPYSAALWEEVVREQRGEAQGSRLVELQLPDPLATGQAGSGSVDDMGRHGATRTRVTAWEKPEPKNPSAKPAARQHTDVIDSDLARPAIRSADLSMTESIDGGCKDGDQAEVEESGPSPPRRPSVEVGESQDGTGKRGPGGSPIDPNAIHKRRRRPAEEPLRPNAADADSLHFDPARPTDPPSLTPTDRETRKTTPAERPLLQPSASPPPRPSPRSQGFSSRQDNQGREEVQNPLAQYSVTEVVDLILRSKWVVVITGAGICTNLGLPDFRSGTGLYSKDCNLADRPEDVFDIDIFAKNPSIFYSAARDLMKPIERFSPTHAFIALLQEKGKLLTNYTQNIDNLEARAGIRSDKLIQCHGSLEYATCMRCRCRRRLQEFAEYVDRGEPPPCPRCEKITKKPKRAARGK